LTERREYSTQTFPNTGAPVF